VLIDLCAAPGGWLQVAAKYAPRGATLVGVDLAAIKPIKGVLTHREDITTAECRAALRRDLHSRKADVVLHDGAPNVGANWAKDAFSQTELVLASLRLACEFLRPRGTFITKVFRSADYNALLWVLGQLFGAACCLPACWPQRDALAPLPLLRASCAATAPPSAPPPSRPFHRQSASSLPSRTPRARRARRSLSSA